MSKKHKNKSPISKESQYIALKNEIVTLTNVKIIIITVMCTVSVAVLGAAIFNDSELFCLLLLLILIPFQGMLNNKRTQIIKISAYIDVFLEEEKGWEYIYQEFTSRWAKSRRSATRFFTRTVSSQLGLATSLIALYLHFAVEENTHGHSTLFSVIFTALMILLLCILIIMNISAFRNNKSIKKGIKMMRKLKDDISKKCPSCDSMPSNNR